MVMSSKEPSHGVEVTTERLARLFGPPPAIAIVLGSGWGGIVKALREPQKIEYAHLPAFPSPKIEGHAGEVIVGKLSNTRVALLRGRAHAYERGNPAEMAGALRSLKRWGVKLVVLTNAAGSLRLNMPPGSVMVIKDHINFPQLTPLLGESDSSRFVDMSNAYSSDARKAIIGQLRSDNQVVHEGVYCWTLGPQFETPAEIKALVLLGGDAVGMSTVPETILARHCGLHVVGLSLVTNMGAGLADERLSHTLTLTEAAMFETKAANMLTSGINALANLSGLDARPPSDSGLH